MPSFLERLFGAGREEDSGSRTLIVGLGNPGAQYERTRHNVGFEVVDVLAEREGISLKRHRAAGLLGWGQLGGRRVGLLKPLSYMNRSGGPVRDILSYFGVPLEDLLIVCDDLNLPLGALRLRPSGSAGGHNGLQNVIDVLRTSDFARLRIGVGGEYSRGRQSEFVLSPFARQERPLVEETLVLACEAVESFVRFGPEVAMSKYNRAR